LENVAGRSIAGVISLSIRLSARARARAISRRVSDADVAAFARRSAAARKLPDPCRGELNELIRFSVEYFCERRGARTATTTSASAMVAAAVRWSNFESNSMQIRWQLCDGRN